MKPILLVPVIATLLNVCCAQKPKIDAKAPPNSPDAPRTTPKILSVTKIDEKEFVGRFEIQQCELASPDGKSLKTVLKFDTSTGETWSLEAIPKGWQWVRLESPHQPNDPLGLFEGELLTEQQRKKLREEHGGDGKRKFRYDQKTNKLIPVE